MVLKEILEEFSSGFFCYLRQREREQAHEQSCKTNNARSDIRLLFPAATLTLSFGRGLCESKTMLIYNFGGQYSYHTEPWECCMPFYYSTCTFVLDIGIIA